MRINYTTVIDLHLGQSVSLTNLLTLIVFFLLVLYTLKSENLGGK